MTERTTRQYVNRYRQVYDDSATINRRLKTEHYYKDTQFSQVTKILNILQKDNE